MWGAFLFPLSQKITRGLENKGNFYSSWLNSGFTPGGALGISSDGDDQMEPKVKTQKNP